MQSSIVVFTGAAFVLLISKSIVFGQDCVLNGQNALSVNISSAIRFATAAQAFTPNYFCIVSNPNGVNSIFYKPLKSGLATSPAPVQSNGCSFTCSDPAMVSIISQSNICTLSAAENGPQGIAYALKAAVNRGGWAYVVAENKPGLSYSNFQDDYHCDVTMTNGYFALIVNIDKSTTL